MKRKILLILTINLICSYSIICQQSKDEIVKILEDSIENKEFIYIRYLPSICCDHGPPVRMIYQESDFDLITKLQEMDLIYKMRPYFKISNEGFLRLKMTLIHSILPKYDSTEKSKFDELHIYIYDKGDIVFKFEIEAYRFETQLKEILKRTLTFDEQNGILKIFDEK